MDPLRIAAKAAFAFVYLLAVVRLSGKTVVTPDNAIEFVLALVFADLIDDAVWGEAPVAQFIVGSGTMFVLRRVLVAVRGPR